MHFAKAENRSLSYHSNILYKGENVPSAAEISHSVQSVAGTLCIWIDHKSAQFIYISASDACR